MGAEVRAALDAGGGVDQKGDGDEDTARHDERQHVAHAVHQVLVELAAEGFVVARGGSGGVGLLVGVEDGRFAVQDLVDQLLRLVDAVGHLRGVDGLAVEACGLDGLVGGDNDAVALGDLLRREHVLRAAGAVGLNLDADAHGLAGLLQSLGGHVGVGDAGGAGRHGEHARAGLRRGSCCGSRGSGFLLGLLGEFLGLLGVDHGEEFLRRLRGLEIVGKAGIHQHLHHAREHFQMHVAVGCRGDHKQELAGHAVGGAVVHAVRHGQRRERGGLHGLTLGVGDGDFHADGGGAHLLALEDALLVRLHVEQVAALLMQRNQLVNGGALVRRGCPEDNAVFFEQVSNAHKRSPLRIMS